MSLTHKRAKRSLICVISWPIQPKRSHFQCSVNYQMKISKMPKKARKYVNSRCLKRRNRSKRLIKSLVNQKNCHLLILWLSGLVLTCVLRQLRLHRLFLIIYSKYKTFLTRMVLFQGVI